ncbi:MAG: PD-(D/E)XK nuclease family protein [Gulosibacter sp.]|uniref:PD-(D/E)XK nuclease family protein n=1 Tax=Gulosibacter sp. TaxID=2817531 RepID=UPI003F8FC94A
MSEQPILQREIDLDETQLRVVESDPRRSLAVIGAPGSGRTTTLVELVAARIAAGVRPEEIIAIAANRKLAADLRDHIEQRVRVAAAGGTLGRTAASLAIEIIAEEQSRQGLPAPKLLTGSQQDDILADLITGLLDEDAPGAAFRAAGEWPDWFGPETLQLRGFRDEMRALLGAMVEEGISPQQLRELALEPNSEPSAGTRHRALWRGAAMIAQQYSDVLDRAFEGSFDSGQALSEAALLLLERDGLGLERRVFDRVKLVVVDDSQELTEPARRLVRAFEVRGAQIVSFGDPDIGTGAFHGGRATLAVNWRDDSYPAPERVELGSVHRHGPQLRSAVQKATAGLGAALAGTQRQTPSVGADARGEVPIAAQTIQPSEVEEMSLITGYLRRLHLLDGVPWEEMAVISRSGARLPALARAFDRARIPTSTSTPLPAADDATVRAIIELGEAAVAEGIESDALQRVLRSPLFGIDPLELRRMRRAHYLADLEHENRAGAQVLTDTVNARLRGEADEVGEATLAQLKSSHGWLGADAVRRVAEVLGRMVGRLRAGDPIDTALFEAWRDEKRAARWQEIALGSETASVAMNRRLDALTVLFDRAKRFVEREPHASLAAFLIEWQRDSVVDDSLAGFSGRDAVTLTTPAGAVGRQWKVVVVAGVNEGVWPNLKVRDSLLGSGRLGEAQGDAPLGIIDRRAEVLSDETRMLVASLSRASERILVTAIAGEDAQPSRYLHSLALTDLPKEFSLGSVGQFGYEELTLEGLVAVLRREIAAREIGAEALSGDAEHALARLARTEVAGAHPSSWFGIRGRSTKAPLVSAEDDTLRLQLYPSGIDSFFECGVNWFIDQYSGSAPSDAMTIGNILHLAAEKEAGFADRTEMMDFAEAKLREMNFDAEWVEEIQVNMVRGAAESLWTYLRRDGSEVIANEHAFRFLLERELESGIRAEITVSGRIDRMEATDSGLRIIDVKTGTKKPTKTELFDNRQLRAYQLAHRHEVLPAAAQQLKVETAALLFPRIRTKDELWSLSEQAAFNADELDVVEDNFLEAAFGEAGFPMAGLAPDLEAAPAYLSDHEKHCLPNNRNCHIHAIAEVTE